MKSALEFESKGSDVGRWKQKMQRCSGSSSVLSPEIIENILCRLPMKDLLRFRVVCKQWEATISDPIFAEIHLQHRKNSNSSSRNHLLAFHNPLSDYEVLHITELRNNCIEFVSAYEPSREYDFINRMTFCSCDGLYLKRSPSWEKGQPSRYVLWNPSCRAYRELCSPLARSAIIHAMYYDPLMKDYKIVIADFECYAVYSCRGNKWGEVKEMKGVWGDYCLGDAVYVDGSVYWLAIDVVEVAIDCVLEKPREVICFDCKNENFRTLPLPTNCRDKFLSLASFGGHLCLFIGDCQQYSGIKIMKKVTSSDGNDGWMESKEECLCSYKPENHPYLVCVLSENEILLRVVSVDEFALLLYDKSKNTLEKILNNYEPTYHSNPRPYFDNLLLL